MAVISKAYVLRAGYVKMINYFCIGAHTVLALSCPAIEWDMQFYSIEQLCYSDRLTYSLPSLVLRGQAFFHSPISYHQRVKM